MIVRTRITACVLLLALAFASAGCARAENPRGAEPSMTANTAPKTGDGNIRTDLAPIAERYPKLIAAETVVWMSGTTGTSDLGPSTYWIDAVVVVPAAEMDALLALDDLRTITAPPLVAGMAEKAPPGPFLGSSALDELFSANGHGATVALDPQTRTVMLSGLFE